MPAESRVQYTIRGIPRELDRALRKEAHRRRISLNRLVIEELTRMMGEPRNYRSLEGLAGRWKEDPEFERVLAEQRQIDWALWR